MLHGIMLISWNSSSLVPGGLFNPCMVAPIQMNIVSILSKQKRSTLRAYLQIRLNSSLLNQSTTLTLVMANYIILYRGWSLQGRQVSTVSTSHTLLGLPKNFDVSNFTNFRWPALSELNDEIISPPWWDQDKQHKFMSDNPLFSPPIMYKGPPLHHPRYLQIRMYFHSSLLLSLKSSQAPINCYS